MDEPVLRLRTIRFVREGQAILDDVDFEVRRGERWLLLGPNGCGKTSLLRIAALYEHPTGGEVEVIGAHLGHVDIREVRRRIGFVSAALADQLRPDLTLRDVVMTAKYAALEPWWHRYTDADRQRAGACLDRLGIGALAEHTFATASSGERTRALIARSLMNDPPLVLLDEPTTGLDLAGREELLATLDALAAQTDSPPFVIVTHHVEDIPTSITHALVLRSGRVLARGPVESVVTDEVISAAFGVDVHVERRPGGRLSAWMAPGSPTTAR